MERLASWASRYGEICIYIRPFNRALYNSYLGRHRAAVFTLRDDELRAVRIIRLLLLMTAVEPRAFCRSLESFREQSATVIIEFDASLSGIGLIWYSINPDGEEYPIGALSVDITSMGFGQDPQYQNTAEFVAATLGILGILHLGLEGCAVTMRGDSMSALCWATSLRFKGNRTSNAALVFTLLLVQTEITVVGYEFLTSQQNVRTDRLSRGDTVEAASRDFVDLRNVPTLVFPAAIEQALLDCHPSLELCDDTAFADLWKRLMNMRALVPVLLTALPEYYCEQY